MMIKVSNEFLEFDELIEVEKQIKLFEEISTTDGDFSYAFELAKTLTNTRILQNPQPDNISKLVYQKIPAKLLSDSGAETFDGFLRIERITEVYHCSFFAGNNNWFGMLSPMLQELDWSEYDIDQTEGNIQQAILSTSGVVFPVLDNGGLLTRGFAHLKVEDFVAGIFVKDVFNKIFSHHGIKIQGELLNDTNYLTAITLNSNKNQAQIDANSVYAEKSTTTTRVSENVQYKMMFQNDSSSPYYDGSNNNFDITTSIFTAPVKMRIDIEVNFKPQIVDASYNNRIYLWINGAFTFVDVGLDAGGLYNSATPGDDEIFTLKRSFVLEQFDTLEVYSEWQQSGGSTQNDVLSGSIKITPTYVYKVFGSTVVPRWTQQKYVSNILSEFNTLTSYNAANKTLTVNLFEKIKSKPAIDLSEYISETEVDYQEFISGYGKKSLFSFRELEEDNFKPVHFAYAKGQIDVDNDFLSDEETVLESDFTHPIGYINPIFDMSMERTNLISMSTDNSVESTAVTDSFGQARFAIPEDIFLLSDMVRIENSTNPIYNGDWMVETITAGFVEFSGLNFDTNATAKITKLVFNYNDSDDVFLFHHVPLYTFPKLSSLPTYRLENADLSSIAFAFFNILNTGRQVNNDFIYSLSFSGEDNELHYQQTMIEQYFRLFRQVLNDPVKLISVAHLPYHIYNQIDFLSPVKILTEETQNVYYLNRIRGYKGSEYPVTLELIKI